ncbi:MAG: redoxin family protein [Salegentibacter sp.]|uniref:Thiol-disulfide isomerase or thioredoxin n=1 Tax=Salegentibacter flavus TaxID=287099 RepID=A0A1I4YLT5_9FLAO|nr:MULTISPECIES: redoxin domain-containing protein [Salegentibacter]MDR9456104.1 redoxin family protein [Salegentibacter sp.]SFN38947.1 Thiol-disulfide isomerase or thioredoxin [Salegentibacter flavus]
MKKILLVFLLIFSIKGWPQQKENDKISFSEALALHLPSYKQKAEKAYRLRNFEEAKVLFDSLVNYKLAGSFMDDFGFKNLKGKEVYLSKFKKPVYLLTYASWHVPGKGELPALNKLAEKYSKEIDFVVVFWDEKKTVKDLSKKFNQHISVLYVDETENEGAFVVQQLKHSLGLPTCFLLNEEKQIMKIKRSVFHPYGISEKESFDMNYEAIEEGIANHLLMQERSGMDLALMPE